VRADHGDAGGDEALLLDGGPAHADRDADSATVRHTRSGDAMPEGGIR
jgi:hypothetical protein